MLAALTNGSTYYLSDCADFPDHADIGAPVSGSEDELQARLGED